MIELERKAFNLLKRIGGSRRNAVRLPVVCPVSVFTADGEGRSSSVATVTQDASISGVRLRLPSVLEVGTRVGLEIELPEGLTEAIGRVLHSERDDFGAYAGIEFTMIESRGKARIARFLATQERRRHPTVLMPYEARCTPEPSGPTVDGATEHCSPGYLTLLLNKPLEPGTAVHITVASRRGDLHLDGHVARCYEERSKWITGVQLDRTESAWEQRWIDHLVELRVAAG